MPEAIWMTTHAHTTET